MLFEIFALGDVMTPSSKGVPENSSPVIPRLFCADPDSAVDYHVRVLGAEDIGRRLALGSVSDTYRGSP
jgi:hypothetical protein